MSTLQSVSVVILARLKLAQGSAAQGWSKGPRAAVPTPLNPFRGHPAAMYSPSLGGSPSPHPRSPDGVGWRCEEQFSRLELESRWWWFGTGVENTAGCTGKVSRAGCTLSSPPQGRGPRAKQARSSSKTEGASSSHGAEFTQGTPAPRTRHKLLV